MWWRLKVAGLRFCAWVADEVAFDLDSMKIPVVNLVKYPVIGWRCKADGLRKMAYANVKKVA